MIELYMSEGRKIRGNKSIYIKMNKPDSDVMDVIKSLNNYYYHSSGNVWEIGIKDFKIILDKCSHKDITIMGILTDEMEHYLDLLDRYDLEDSPLESQTEPYQHQYDCYEYAKRQSKFLLADEQGLGKTKQALDIAIMRKPKMSHCLIVCGVNDLKWNWLKEIGIHTQEKGHILGMKYNTKNKLVVGSVADRLEDLNRVHDEYFLITNIETLRDKNVAKKIKSMCDSGVIGMTIIDEIHKCKNATSKQGKAIHCCTSYYRLALTGTPIMNNAIDLYNVLKWLEIDNRTKGKFEFQYCIKGGFGGYEIVGYKNLDHLQSRLDKYMLRRKKDDVLNLPPKIYTDELIEMSSDQWSIYNEVLDNIQDNIDKVLLMPNPLTELIRLRQTTSNPNILTSKNIKSAKYNRMMEIVEEVSQSGGKCIIFSNWTKVINPAYDLLKRFNPALVTGEVKDTQSQQDKFKKDSSCKVILGTISCLGTGFTLTEANTVIFLDEPWTMANKLQAEDRCHRIGTTGTVNIITLLCKDTIDEKINKLVKSKGALSDGIIDNKLSKDDIKNLLEG